MSGRYNAWGEVKVLPSMTKLVSDIALDDVMVSPIHVWKIRFCITFGLLVDDS